jgi:hypothetical protein
MAIIEAYEAGYIFKKGYPLIIIASQPHPDGGVVAEILILFEESSAGASKFSFEATVLMNQTSPRMYDDLGIGDAVQHTAEEAKMWAERHLQYQQSEALDKNQVDVLLRPVTLSTLKPWKTELVRRRLRGLNENIIAQMSRTTVYELSEFLRRLPIDFQPITVRSPTR